ncbi:CDP-alcohol phosphatidyltransferase family protein [Morganella morganii]|uniref:CDP-alcohol phosphatidyltransferase family protein n=1 Tax=Morganella morganii TaxID=582 RepID=UPI00164AD73D|nr:CDP-alcohol phosphatidyltransferase family protein [Morganella morganii]MBC4011437.1 CDP-alcohol phosphatidyltransferase family protein [Morganella morganii]
MTIYDLKPKFQNLLRPVVIRLFNAGITANQVTLAAMFLSLLTGFILILFPDPRLFLLLPPVLFIRMALNAIDGMLAREHNQKSRFGAILNELGDVVSDTILYFPFVLLFPGAAIWILLILFLSVLTEFIGVLAQTIGASRRYDGPAGKSDRAFLFGALGLCAAVFPASLDSALFPVLFAIFSALLFLTCYHRIRRALQESAQQSASQKD